GLEARAAAGGAGVVGAVQREKHANVHLVRVALEPAEESLHAVPGLRPLEAAGAVARFTFDDERALLRGQRREWHVGRDLSFSRELEEILLRLAVDFAFPALDRAVVDRLRLVGYRKPVVDLDHAAESAALGAGSERRIEGEQCRRGGTKCAPGPGRVKPAREMSDGLECIRLSVTRDEQVQFALSKMQRRFRRLEEPAALAVFERNTVLCDVEVRRFCQWLGILRQHVDAVRT